MRSDPQRWPTRRACGVIALATALMLGLGACRSDLVVPSPESAGDVAPLVQPYLRVLASDGIPLPWIEVSIDSGFYRTGAGSDFFSASGPISRFPDPVPAPFLLEVWVGSRGHRILLDVFPAPAETLDVDFDTSNVRLRMSPPAGIDPALFTVLDAEVRVQFSNRSEHAVVDRSRSFSQTLRAERTDPQGFRAAVPTGIDSVRQVSATWRVTDPHSKSSSDGRITYEQVPFGGELDLTLTTTLRTMGLQVFWGGGAFEVEDFRYDAYTDDGLDPTERVRLVHRPGTDPALIVGLLRPMRVRIVPSALSGVLQWEGRIQWNGVDPVHIELGRHALQVRVVDTEGRPVAFTNLLLEQVPGGFGYAEQATDELGLARFYVNDGEYVAYLAHRRYEELGPRGGPWRVTGDASATWVIP